MHMYASFNPIIIDLKNNSGLVNGEQAMYNRLRQYATNVVILSFLSFE